MTHPKLKFEIESIVGHPYPTHQLEISCRITNPAQHDLCILDIWARIEALSGLRLAEGKVFQTMYNRVDLAVIEAGKEGRAKCLIDLLPRLLNELEQRRVGGDVTLHISSRILASVVHATTNRPLGMPFETDFASRSDSQIEHRIPQSEWIRILTSIGWSELEILEVPVNALRSDQRLQRAFGRFQDAQKCLRRGDWDETLLNCRKCFEAITQDLTGSEDMSKSQQALENLIADSHKTEYINNIVLHLSKFLHLGRHEQLSTISIGPSDARLALHLTGALLAYLSQP